MKPEEQWKDGPGHMKFGETIILKAVRRSPSAPGIAKERVDISFEVFGSHVEIYWNVEDDDFSWHNQRNLSDGQKRYLKFLVKLISFTNYKDLRPEL